MAEAVEAELKVPNRKEKRSIFYASRYNGKFKKRQWEEEEGSESKRIHLEPGDRIKRKKCLVLLGYSGVNYFGMQRNPAMKTIEEDLLAAMLKNKWITDEAFGQAQTIQFQRAARTDKGVSATRQCVSLKLPDGVDVSAINADLPEQIKVFAVKKVTKGFNSKDQCNARTYTYTIPTVALANHKDVVSLEDYRVPSEKIEKFNEILKLFEGTKNFHNFTSRKEFTDPSSKRFIISFVCGQPFIPQDNTEFVVLKVQGQSFMLHQIRKMVGMSLAIIRGLTTVETMERAFSEERLDLPMAPGLGLVLDQVHYDRYNRRYGEDGIHETLDFLKEEPEIKEFFDKFIIPTIVNTEIKEKSICAWLETLPIHSYDVREADKKTEEEKSDELKEDLMK